MNWDDIRVFLAVYRAGTLRGAAHALGVDQTTVSRRLTALESRLCARLFLRTSAGYVLTESGESALQVAEPMERLAVSFERRTEGANERVSGEVRITTTDALAVDFVIPAIERLRGSHPEVSVVLTTTTRVLDLARREADIAIRTVRPTNADLIVRKLAEWDVGLYASRRYIETYGEPQQGMAFAGHDLAVYQPGVTNNQDNRLAGEQTTRGRIVAELDSSLMLATFIRAGLAVGELPSYQAQRDPDLVRIWPRRKRNATYEAWLVLHNDLARTARVRVVVDALTCVFEQTARTAG
jgi:DNA-binding transcriptional LysR family regulator